jgi:MoxR-like ATPase
MADDAALAVDTQAQNGVPVRELDLALSRINRIIHNVERVIFGKRDAIEQVLVGLLADGHVLLEDVPGVGKTMMARALAKSLSAEFRRIQFTPDLLPADVTGSMTYNQQTHEFFFRRGPIFANILLADEINRTSPRTQSALLEGMEERQVTADGETYHLPELFFVIATENPIEQQGTYELPEAQLDRFMVCVKIGYPAVDREADILEAQRLRHPLEDIEAICTPQDVLSLQELVRRIHVTPSLRRYMAQISAASRIHHDVRVGISVRGTQKLMHAAQALALIGHRDYVTPDDIQQIAPATLAHRLILRPEARLAGVDEEAIVSSLLRQVEVPVQ